MQSVNEPKPSAIAHRIRVYFEGLQDQICHALEEVEGEARFTQDVWVRPEGGGGKTRVIQGGRVFEKAGVNTSAVYGPMSESVARRLNVTPADFYATGISLVIHPVSPMVPTVHANYRYFENGDDAWFGGGSDLTPYYPNEEDIIHFHSTLKSACDPHGTRLYPEFKKACDEYFSLRHRGEGRGVGGIFFDYQRGDREKLFSLVREAGDSFLESYLPIVKRRMQDMWGARERTWQLQRRGRYVEFNLLYDRGTLFGLETGGRIESILMSLPPEVRWDYDVKPEPGSPEARLLELLAHPREWVA